VIMLDVVFEGMQAWNQTGLLIGGFMLLFIGGGMAGFELYWRIKGVPVKGRISGIQAVKTKDTDERWDEPTENVVSEKSIKDEEEGGGKAVVVITLIIVAIPMLFAVLGAGMAYKYISLTSSGIHAEATVVRNRASSDSDGTSYYAVIEFRDQKGMLWEVDDNVGGSSPTYQEGESVGVYYDAGDPERFVIHDFWHYMGIALGFMAIGSLGLVVLSVLYIKHKAEKAGQALGDGQKKIQSYKGEVYYPVYEYQDMNGERIEQVGKMGGNSFLNIMPGKRVRLLMLPDRPEQVKNSSWLFLILGTTFVLPGIFLLYMAFTQFENTPIALLFVLIIVGVVALRARSGIKALKEKLSGMDMDGSGVSSLGSHVESDSTNRSPNILAVLTQGAKLGKNARLLSAEEVSVRVKKQALQASTIGYIVLFLALGCSVGSYFTGLDMLDLSLKGQSGVGKVVDINSRRSSSTSGGSSGYSYYAVVSFNDAQGEKVRFEDGVGSSHPFYDMGDDVDVLYDPDRPIDAIIDRGLLNWGLSGGLALGALLLLLLGVNTLKQARAHGGMRYRTRM